LGKSQEVGRAFFVIVGYLGSLSREEVERYKQLFLDAIRQYETDVVEQDRQSKPYLDDVRYSLLPTLKEKVTSGKEIPSDELRLLSEILQEYHARLAKLKGKTWVRQATVDTQLEQFDRLVRDDIVRLNSHRPMVKSGHRCADS
jgi:hypothetical protein